MNIKNNLKGIAASVAAILFSCLLSSCQGRKMTNMQPTGDTVEVEIAAPDMPADTAVTAADTIHTS